MDDQQHDQQQDMTAEIPVPNEPLDTETRDLETSESEMSGTEMSESETVEADRSDADTADLDETATESNQPRRSGRLRAAAPYVLAGAVGLAAGAGVVGLVHGLDGDGHGGRSADHVDMGRDGQMGRRGQHDDQQGRQQMRGGFAQPGSHGPMQGRSGGS